MRGVRTVLEGHVEHDLLLLGGGALVLIVVVDLGAHPLPRLGVHTRHHVPLWLRTEQLQ